MKVPTQVAGESGSGAPEKLPEQSPPMKALAGGASDVAGVAGGGAIAGVDALKPVLEQLTQAITAIMELLKGQATGAEGGGPVQQDPGQGMPPGKGDVGPGKVGGASGAGQNPPTDASDKKDKKHKKDKHDVAHPPKGDKPGHAPSSGPGQNHPNQHPNKPGDKH